MLCTVNNRLLSVIPQCTRTTGGWPLRDDRRELLRDSGTGANVRNTQVGTQSINYAYCSIYINTVQCRNACKCTWTTVWRLPDLPSVLCAQTTVQWSNYQIVSPSVQNKNNYDYVFASNQSICYILHKRTVIKFTYFHLS